MLLDFSTCPDVHFTGDKCDGGNGWAWWSIDGTTAIVCIAGEAETRHFATRKEAEQFILDYYPSGK